MQGLIASPLFQRARAAAGSRSASTAIYAGVASKEMKPLTDSPSILRRANTTGDKYTENALCNFSPYVWLVNSGIIIAAVWSILSVSHKRSHYAECGTRVV